MIICEVFFVLLRVAAIATSNIFHAKSRSDSSSSTSARSSPSLFSSSSSYPPLCLSIQFVCFSTSLLVSVQTFCICSSLYNFFTLLLILSTLQSAQQITTFKFCAAKLKLKQSRKKTLNRARTIVHRKEECTHTELLVPISLPQYSLLLLLLHNHNQDFAIDNLTTLTWILSLLLTKTCFSFLPELSPWKILSLIYL